MYKFIAIALFLANISFAEEAKNENFEQKKLQAISFVDQQIASLNKAKSCLQSASTVPALKSCREQFKSDKQAIKSERKAARSKNIDERIKKLEEHKKKIEEKK